MTQAFKLKMGDKVTGTYCNSPFSGIVQSSRFHTCRADIVEITVKLDAEIDVFGQKRDEVQVICGLYGESVKGWNGSIASVSL